MEELKRLKELTDICGVSGNEYKVSQYLIKNLDNKKITFTYDNLGSLVGKLNNSKGAKVLVASHMDEVGLMVREITPEGFLKFQTIGGWYSQVMLGQKWLVETNAGKYITAVTGAKPPHLMTREEASKVVTTKEMYLDLGATSKEEVEKLGIEIGSYVTPYCEFMPMANPKLLLAKAWDNRIGTAVVMNILETVNEAPCELYGGFNVQEEVGLRGAKTSSYMVNPDIAIALDSGIASDVPGCDKTGCELGKGPQIIFYDGGLLPNQKLKRYILDTAKKHEIPVQLTYLEGGSTDAAMMQYARNGAATIAMLIPARYIHSHCSIIHIDDYLNCVKLLKEVIKGLNEKEVKKILSF